MYIMLRIMLVMASVLRSIIVLCSVCLLCCLVVYCSYVSWEGVGRCMPFPCSQEQCLHNMLKSENARLEMELEAEASPAGRFSRVEMLCEMRGEVQRVSWDVLGTFRLILTHVWTLKEVLNSFQKPLVESCVKATLCSQTGCYGAKMVPKMLPNVVPKDAQETTSKIHRFSDFVRLCRQMSMCLIHSK